MAGLEENAKRRDESKSGNRFYTSRDMAIVKHDAAKKDAEVKRGEAERHNNQDIIICGCGVEGCFLHLSSPSAATQEEHNKNIENKRPHHQPKDGRKRKKRDGKA